MKEVKLWKWYNIILLKEGLNAFVYVTNMDYFHISGVFLIYNHWKWKVFDVDEIEFKSEANPTTGILKVELEDYPMSDELINMFFNKDSKIKKENFSKFYEDKFGS